MRSSVASALLSSAALVQAASNAPIITNNVAGASYVAQLPYNAPIQGSIVGTSDPSGTGTQFSVSLSGFPSSGGPFLYHIHVNQVPANGSCVATLGHLDPTLRGETPACDPTQPATCQVGDLSGKHGSINGPSYSANYNDPFISTTPGNAAFFGNRSVVVHYANLTRIACANFVLASAGANITSPVANTTLAAPASVGTGTYTNGTSSSTGAGIYSNGTSSNSGSASPSGGSSSSNPASGSSSNSGSSPGSGSSGSQVTAGGNTPPSPSSTPVQRAGTVKGAAIGVGAAALAVVAMLL